MTHQNNYTFSQSQLEDLTQQGLDGAAEMIRIMINEAMRAEREKYLAASSTSEQRTAKATQTGTSQRR